MEVCLSRPKRCKSKEADHKILTFQEELDPRWSWCSCFLMRQQFHNCLSSRCWRQSRSWTKSWASHQTSRSAHEILSNLLQCLGNLRDGSHSGKVGPSWITGAGCQGGGFREAGRQRYEGCLRPHQPTPTHAGGGHWAFPSSLWAAVLRCYRYKQMAQMGIGWWSDVLLKHRFEIVLWIQFDIN